MKLSQFDGTDEYVQTLFNEIADDYDHMNTLMTWGMLKGWPKFVIDKAQLKAGDSGEDVCCGEG